MPYTDLQQLSAVEFKRLCGVTRKTFNKMVEKVQPHLERQGRSRGTKQTHCRRQTAGEVRVLAGI